MVPDTQDADTVAGTDTTTDGDDEGSRFGRWWQHFLDLLEFVFDLF